MLMISEISRPGFKTILKTEQFKCAFITHENQYTYGPVASMKRHNLTDEVFVLLSGRATLLICQGETMTEYPMVQKKAYNVTAGTWHYLAVSSDAVLFVVESSDTDSTNTDVMTLANPYRLI